MASKDKSKFKTKDKPLSISQPLNFEHTAHVGLDNSWRSTPLAVTPTSSTTGQPLTNVTTGQSPTNATTQPPTNATTNTDQQLNGVDITTLLASTLEQFKEDIRNIIHKEITETIILYQPHFVNPTELGPDRRGNSESSDDKDVTKSTNGAKLYHDHDYLNIDWGQAKCVQLRSGARNAHHLWKGESLPSRLLSDSDKALGRSLSSPWKQSTEKKTESTERRATVSVPAIHSGVHTAADDRECLANALQSHIVMMVNNVLFTETQLPDLLNEQGFLTDEECYTMRGLPNRKDRIRTLISVMKGRDLAAIKGFLKYLDRFNPDVVKCVYKTYESNKANGMRCKRCAFCNMKTKVDIKYVVDSIWSIFAIPDGLYNEIIVSQKPAGAQEVIIFWDRLADILNSHDTNLRTKAVEALIECLTVKNYRHIADTFTRQLLNGNPKLKCQCKVVPLRHRVSFVCSTATSLSPGSSPYSSCEILADLPKGQESGDPSLESIYETLPVNSNTSVKHMYDDGVSSDRDIAPDLPPRLPQRPNRPPPVPSKCCPPLPHKKPTLLPKPSTDGISITITQGAPTETAAATKGTDTETRNTEPRPSMVPDTDQQAADIREGRQSDENAQNLLTDNRQPDASYDVENVEKDSSYA